MATSAPIFIPTSCIKKKNAILIKGFATYSMNLNYVCMLKSPGLTSRDSDLIDLGYFGVKGMGKRDSELDVHEVFRWLFWPFVLKNLEKPYFIFIK